MTGALTEIVHVVGWRLRGDSEAERLRHAETVVAAVGALRGQIPGLLSLDVGANVIPAPEAWDVAAVMVFRSRADLDAYQDHPAHQTLKTVVGPLRSARSQIDFPRAPSQPSPSGEHR